MSHQFQNYEAASKFERNRLGVTRLSSEQARLVREAVERHQQRADRRSIYDPLAAKKIERYSRVNFQIAAELEDLLFSRYRISQSRWAGGENTLIFKISPEPFGSGTSYKAWSSNGKWSGTSAQYHLNIQKCWRQQVLAVPGLVVAGGMLTTHAKLISPGVWEASWVVQQRGFSIGIQSGVIVQDGDRFYHGATEEKARAAIARRIQQEKLERKSGSIAAELRSLSAERLVERYGSLTINRADSIRCGNCEDGTDSWIEQNFEGRKQATVSDVIQKDSGERVLAACRAAVLRQVKKLAKV